MNLYRKLVYFLCLSIFLIDYTIYADESSYPTLEEIFNKLSFKLNQNDIELNETLVLLNDANEAIKSVVDLSVIKEKIDEIFRSKPKVTKQKSSVLKEKYDNLVAKINEMMASKSNISDIPKSNQPKNTSQQVNTASNTVASNTPKVEQVLLCDNSINKNYAKCIELCKSDFTKVRKETGYITETNVKQISNCMINCKNNILNVKNCKLTKEQTKLLNETISLPKPTYPVPKRNSRNNESLIHYYLIRPIKRFIFYSLFCFFSIIGVLYYFRNLRIYPKIADYITDLIENLYTDDEKRRAIFEGDNFKLSFKDDWKMTLIYLIRLKYLPKFFGDNFPWLIPTRDFANNMENNYVQMS